METRPNKFYAAAIVIVVLGMILAAGLGGLAGGLAGYYAAGRRALPTPATVVERVEVPVTPQVTAQSPVAQAAIASEEQVVEALYERVNPSVVYISVAVRAQGMSFPFGQGQGGGQYQYGSGSGFVYDRQGHI
ncbi:MAG: hypothetical protein GXY76_23240, partial [Chloroflexi bacterium]|nr:hypothetical protein [Chloroflexota bacterium]